MLIPLLPDRELDKQKIENVTCQIKTTAQSFLLVCFVRTSSFTTNTLALLPLVKGEVFCVGKRLKMVKHKAWATTIVAHKSVGSMTTKGQMKPTCRMSSTASQAGENSQSNAPEHTIVSSILF